MKSFLILLIITGIIRIKAQINIRCHINIFARLKYAAKDKNGPLYVTWNHFMRSDKNFRQGSRTSIFYNPLSPIGIRKNNK
jgi:hypothetical protein